MMCILLVSSTASWPLEVSKDEKQGWRYVRIQQNGKNASGQTHYLSLSGFEIYGAVTGVCNDLGRSSFDGILLLIKCLRYPNGFAIIGSRAFL